MGATPSELEQRRREANPYQADLMAQESECVAGSRNAPYPSILSLHWVKGLLWSAGDSLNGNPYFYGLFEEFQVSIITASFVDSFQVTPVIKSPFAS